MKADSILSTEFTILMVMGIVLLYLSIGTDDITDVVVGMGATSLGILGLEVHEIKKINQRIT